MGEKQVEISECDEAGNVTATYIQTATDQDGTSRVDAILPDTTKSPWQRVLDIFLPAGYPHSVTDDYMEYQIFDSLQAFSSSIAGLLSSRAVLSSVGVGDSTASPTAALLLSIFQESVGRIATILFAHRLGQAFEPECKMYRLLADVLNDMAFVLDCLSPALPKSIRVIVLSFSSVLRALCGVAAGSAKASLSAHFAKWGNLGELNAKDSSQETVISLLGMLAGSLVVSVVKSPIATWTTLILLLSIHLETNRRAVRAVTMHTLNRQRATLLCHHLRRDHVPTPQDIAREERIFESDGVLKNANGLTLGYCTMGLTFSDFLRTMGTRHSQTRSTNLPASILPRLLELYRSRAYLLYATVSDSRVEVQVVFKRSASTKDLLIAWWQAVVLVDGMATNQESSAPDFQDGEGSLSKSKIEQLKNSAESAAQMFQRNEAMLKKAGWDIDTGALETRTSCRVEVHD